MKKLHGVLIAGFLSLLVGRELRAGDLRDIIPNLYGGDGFAPSNFDPTGHQGHFTAGAADQLNKLNQDIGSQIPLFPISSAVGAFTFNFDESLGAFVNTTMTLGPIFAERAETLGRGKLNLSFSGTFFSYDTFNGKSLNHIKQDFHHAPDNAAFTNDFIQVKDNIDIDVRLLTIAATIGVTDNLDLGMVLPVVQVDMGVVSDATIVVSPLNTTSPNAHRFISVVNGVTNRSLNAVFTSHDEANGVGDIVLRAKYRFPKNPIVDVAGAVQLQLASGNAANFLGTGETFVKPLLVLSRTFPNVAGTSLTVAPHLNLGYNADLGDQRQDAFTYVAGFDVGTKRWSVALELLGSHLTDPNGISDDILNGSVGVKYSLYKAWVLFGNVQFPLNINQGLRSYVVPTLGVEYTLW